MFINSIEVKNFRLLQETKLSLDPQKRQDLTLLIGKNNSGKTSFIVLLDKFFRDDYSKFNFNDFSVRLRDKIKAVKASPDLGACSIQLKLEITFDKNDNLAVLSDFILDLRPEATTVRLLFECAIDSAKLNNDLDALDVKHHSRFIEKNLSDYVVVKIYCYIDENELAEKARDQLVEKSRSDINRLINYQVIHAKRNVSSSEHEGNRRNALSELASSYFNKANLFSKEAFGKINDTILEADDSLNKTYAEHFKSYFETAKQFVSGSLNVISNLESKQILDNYSRVVYGDTTDTYLPETLNGLGHLNILFLLLNIEVKKKFIEQEKRDINLLFIEEPEAHTHPQMQYVFAQRIKSILKEIPNLQTFITSHSSHIVSQCDFDDLRYFKAEGDKVLIKNFHQELAAKYGDDEDHFKFLKQFLTLYASELFFAEKIVFLEGASEKLLLPYFIKQYDNSKIGTEGYIALTSQNVSFIEAGANARVFQHFIEFLDIKTMIITDFDCCKDNDEETHIIGCPANQSNNTSNVTLKHYYNAPDRPKKAERAEKVKELQEFNDWFTSLKEGRANSVSERVGVFYQLSDGVYHPRSFEDAFISKNLVNINKYKDDIRGLQYKNEIHEDRTDFYELTNQILKVNGKSDFASSLLYLALVKDVNWTAPAYITNALNWISK